jgi:hypothetical protein
LRDFSLRSALGRSNNTRVYSVSALVRNDGDALRKYSSGNDPGKDWQSDPYDQVQQHRINVSFGFQKSVRFSPHNDVSKKQKNRRSRTHSVFNRVGLLNNEPSGIAELPCI